MVPELEFRKEVVKEGGKGVFGVQEKTKVKRVAQRTEVLPP